VGLRVPDQPIALALLKKFEELGGQGIAAPSANRFGAVSPTTAQDVGEELGDYLGSDDLVLDGGQCSVGIESTIIDGTDHLPKILRPGAITEEMIELTIGSKLRRLDNSPYLRAPGMLQSHYSPRAKVCINGPISIGDGLIALSEIDTPKGVIRLASPKSKKEFAKDLYSALRKGDAYSLSKIVVYLPGGDGISAAIQDRIIKASY
jgi:L-threonylcarbamoyladenylate synthase